MKELAVVTSDIHIHKYKDFNEGNRRLLNGIAYIDYLFNFCSVNGINYILLPGDLYNLMQIVSTEVEDAMITCFKKNFSRYPLITIVAISGNHDHATKNLIDAPAVSALRHLAITFDNFILLDEKIRFATAGGNYIFGIPYYEYMEHFQQELDSLVENVKRTVSPSDRAYLMMHQVVTRNLPIENHIEPDDSCFNNFDLVFNGHIHDGEELTDKFINIGSPMHRDKGDMGKRKGFWILDLSDPDTISFKDITDKFPQYIQKEEGSILTEWEEKQYVTFAPAIKNKTVAEHAVIENFKTSQSPETILTNYAEAAKLADDYINYGMQLL